MSISKGSLLASVLMIFVITSFLSKAVDADTISYKYWDINESHTPQKALEAFSMILDYSDKIPIFIVAYNSTREAVMKQIYLEEANRMLQRRKYGASGTKGLLVSVDLHHHASLPLGHAYKFEGEEKPAKMVPFLATMISNRRIAKAGVITTFDDKNAQGKMERVGVLGVADTIQPGMNEAQFRDSLFNRMALLYDKSFR